VLQCEHRAGKGEQDRQHEKKGGLAMLDQKVPRYPVRMLPIKMVVSQTPISIESKRAGATFITSERLVGIGKARRG
jgi:hypothetical protein